MGLRGPLPKSPAARIAGKIGASLAPGTHYPTGTPNRPEWLEGEAAAEWDRIVPELEASGLLAFADRAALAAYCQAWAELVWATGIVEKEGRVIAEPLTSSKGELVGERLKAHPAVKLQRDSFNRLQTFIQQFGMSPGSRSRLGSVQGGEGTPTAGRAGNPFAAIAGHVSAARANGAAG